MATTFSAVGRPVGRTEGPRKVTGQEVYGIDVIRPGMLWGKALRSPFPHARILSIDTSRARQLPGVHAVLTAQDLPGERVGRVLRDMPVLASDRVLFVGEKVAAVAAESLEVAEEALLLIDVEYEELPEVVDPMEAMKPDAPVLHPELPAYVGMGAQVPAAVNDYGRLWWSMGDVGAGFAQSDLVIEHTFTTQLMHQGYLEAHACAVKIDRSGRAHVWANNKTPYALRKQLAEAAQLSPADILVHPCAIGGDFGGKGSFMDVPLCYFLARASGRPVKMVMSYIEELMAGNPRHASIVSIKSGVKNDGTLVARHVTSIFPRGAYGAFIPSLFLGGARYSLGSYRIPNVLIEGRMVYTNTVPCGHFRAPGEAQVLFAVESHTDLIAKALGQDPYAFRLHNVIEDGDVAPSWESSEGVVAEPFTHSRGAEVLAKAAEASGWSQKRGIRRGRGMALANRRPGTGVGHCTLRVEPDGRVSILTPLYETGTGTVTIAVQIVAEELGLSVQDVGVEVLDTDQLPSDSGIGAMRVTYTHGWAAVKAAQALKARLVELASTLLEWPEDQIVYQQGALFLKSQPDQSIGLQELAGRAATASAGPIMAEQQVSSSPAESAAFCVVVADVEVDTETGQVKVLRLVSTNEVGTILNPLAHQGQIEGGLVMGLGYTFTEEMVLDQGRVTTLSLGDYKLPNVQDIPPLETVLVEGSQGPMPYSGWGVGESTLAPVAPAIANAIEDAVSVRIASLPITAEKLLEALRLKAKKGAH